MVEDHAEAADLGGGGDQRAEERCDQREQAELEAEPMADEAEHRLVGNGGDSAAHLAEDDDADGRDGERRNERIAEHRAGLPGEDQLADVDEAADGRHDAEGQFKRIQGCPRSA
jgi:hypothetical protein